MVALHAEVPVAKSACNVLSNTPCSTYNTDFVPAFTPYSIYLVVAKADELAGIQSVSFSIDHDPAVQIFAWAVCADLDFPSPGWPGTSGASNVVTWGSCQSTTIGTEGVHAVAGYLYTYAYGDGLMVVGPRLGALQVTDCFATPSDISQTPGAIGFNSRAGYNPCSSVVPTEETTWGRLKNQFGD